MRRASLIASARIGAAGAEAGGSSPSESSERRCPTNAADADTAEMASTKAPASSDNVAGRARLILRLTTAANPI
jgi:hypothetical protein